jgi:hypothetical protein
MKSCPERDNVEGAGGKDGRSGISGREGRNKRGERKIGERKMKRGRTKA